MTRFGSWLAAGLTLLTLGGLLGLMRDANRGPEYAAGTAALVVGATVVFIRRRIRGRDADWRLTAPALLAVTAISTSRAAGVVIALIMLLGVGASFQLIKRQRGLSAYAETTVVTGWLAAALVLAVVAAIGEARGATLWLVVATAWLLVWMPPSTRYFHDQHTLHVRRPPDEVSAYLLDQRNIVAWYPGFKSADLLDGHDLGVGAIFRQSVELRGQLREARVTVDEYEVGHRLCTRVLDAPGRGTGCYTFTADEDGTVAQYEFSGEQAYTGALTGAKFLYGRALREVRAQRQEAYDSLKAILEA